MARFDAAQVRRHYDRHTPFFVAFGQDGRVGAIHRAVWGPGVGDRRGALHYVEDQIAAARTIERFRQGWHVNALLQPDELRDLARMTVFRRVD